DSDFKYFTENNNKSFGPGIVDMKGGLVVGIYAIKALDAAGLLKSIPIKFAFNSDEEIGSRGSRDFIKDEAKDCKFAIVLEAGGDKGGIVTGRKGGFSSELKLYGEAGHAAFVGKNKKSTILEFAHKALKLEALNDFDKGITVNIGKVKAGDSYNIVPKELTALIDCRYSTSEDYENLMENITRIVNTSHVKGVKSEFKLLMGRPPMEQSIANKELFNMFKTEADKLNMPLWEEFRKGGSDANVIASCNIPVIDGLGPEGGKDHSEDEFMITKTLLDKTILLSCFLANTD
ncbi:M20/M25/M40 family metallo-hydrolase, partial [Desulfococcaceae bacterium HSG8]|nr:M20/M25/M40 family metallo-hydrolase [Desulfococcaceae bacterium HSG8]